MKVIRATAAVAFFVALTVASVSAQTRPAAGSGTQPRPAATPGPTAPSTVSVPDSKVALIDSSAFADEKQGIAKFVSALKRVNAEFQPRQTELQQLSQQQIEKANMRLQKRAGADAKVNQTSKTESADGKDSSARVKTRRRFQQAS